MLIHNQLLLIHNLLLLTHQRKEENNKITTIIMEPEVTLVLEVTRALAEMLELVAEMLEPVEMREQEETVPH